MESSDEQILESEDFVEKPLAEAEDRQKGWLTGLAALRTVEKTIEAICVE